MTTKKTWLYLEWLRRTGQTNMFGAVPYLINEFGFDNEKPKEELANKIKPLCEKVLFDKDYEVYIEKDFDTTIFEFPIYYIFIKDKNDEIDLNGNSITIEII